MHAIFLTEVHGRAKADFPSQGSWAGANYSEVSIDEDLQFVSDLLDEIRLDYCVDDSRIYATG